MLRLAGLLGFALIVTACANKAADSIQETMDSYKASIEAAGNAQ